SSWMPFLSGAPGADVMLVEQALADRQVAMPPVVLTELRRAAERFEAAGRGSPADRGSAATRGRRRLLGKSGYPSCEGSPAEASCAARGCADRPELLRPRGRAGHVGGHFRPFAR